MAMPAIPPLNFQSASDAKGQSSAMFDNSGFVVNYGGAVSQGGAVPQWAVMAAVIGGVVWMLKKR